MYTLKCVNFIAHDCNIVSNDIWFIENDSSILVTFQVKNQSTEVELT